MTEKILDQPAVLRILFHPRPGATFLADAQPVSVDVKPGVSISGYLFSAGDSAPAILYFHGNGEIAADYVHIAPAYTRLGITLLVMDYRGYGQSSGTPTGSNLLSDAGTIYEAVDEIFAEQGLKPGRLFIMGRSLGSASALEIASRAGDSLAGLIIESGFADTFSLVARLGGPALDADDATEGFGNAAKISSITIPTLVIHGEEDFLIPAGDGQTLYEQSAASQKQLLLIPNAGHNDIMMVGMQPYFKAVDEFVRSVE